MTEFKGKTAIVTGAAQGIGFKIAQELLEQGANVLINDLDQSQLNQANDQLSDHGSRLQIYPGDASKKEVITGMVGAAVKQFTCLDLVVANAGLTIQGPFLDFSEVDLRKMLELNLVGTFLLAQTAARLMINMETGGRILFLSSVTGIQAHKELDGYGMTKAALIMLAKSLGVELAPYGITVNCVAPGATETERTMQNPDYAKDWARFIPTGRPSKSGDIAKACLFLLGSHSSQITGQTLIVDGGWSATGPMPDQI